FFFVCSLFIFLVLVFLVVVFLFSAFVFHAFAHFTFAFLLRLLLLFLLLHFPPFFPGGAQLTKPVRHQCWRWQLCCEHPRQLGRLNLCSRTVLLLPTWRFSSACVLPFLHEFCV